MSPAAAPPPKPTNPQEPQEPLARKPGRNPLSPKKLLLTKWTAVTPRHKEKHFVVIRVVLPEPPEVRIEQVELEAVHSKRTMLLHWRELTDGAVWRQGWV